jgi:hypothetical protein
MSPTIAIPERIKRTLNIMDPGFARRRIWAAGLRDGKGPYAENASLLCRVLDLYEEIAKRASQADSASNLSDSLRLSVESLIGRLLADGAAPPDMGPAVLK